MAVDFGKQIGPLPLGAWVVVVAGGLGIAWYSTRQGTEPEIVEDGSGQPGVGDGTVGGWIPQQPPTAQPNPNGKDSVTDNDAWYRYVFSELVARNYDSTLVDSALRKYLAGLSSKLSVAEWVIIRAALSIMPPPSPIPAQPDDPNPPTIPTPTVPKPPTSTPKPTVPKPPPPKPKPPAPKPRLRYYTVQRGDNLWNIAKRYYGSGIYWPKIYYANRANSIRLDRTVGFIRNPNLIYPGWRLIIP